MAKPDVLLTDLARPRTRGECRDGPRPCPWVSCRHHLLVEVRDRGEGREPALVRPGSWLGPDADPAAADAWTTAAADHLATMADTCALDVAERLREVRGNVDGEATHGEVGAALGVTRESARLESIAAAEKLRAAHPELAEFLEPEVSRSPAPGCRRR